MPLQSQEKYAPTDFSKIKIGLKTLDDAVITLGNYKKINPKLGDRDEVMRAITNNDLSTMKEISLFFYRTSGIYNRLCRYMAYLYRYDWFITPYFNSMTDLIEKAKNFGQIDDQTTEKEKDKQLKSQVKNFNNFLTVLKYLDKCRFKKLFGEIALKVVKYGCYYGYWIPQKDRMVIQELPVNYCRSRFKVNDRPAIEFNMKFFDDMYRDQEQKQRVLKAFPKDFQDGYRLLRQNKLKGETAQDDGWYLLDPIYALKFNINDEDFPPFIAVVPSIIDLDAAQDLDRKKMAQKLLKIIIQKMPLDKNGELVFDVDEAQQLHNNAVRMLGRAIGIDVLTTFADVEVADMSDRSNLTSADELVKVERTVYNEAGVSQLQFNSNGNTALQNSILNDQASMYNLLTQFEGFINTLLDKNFNKNKQVYYEAQILTTTVYNYKELAKLYKEQAQMGYNKMLPQVALGQNQSSILANAYFENDILNLVKVFIPPLTSNVMNAEALQMQGSQGAEVSNKTGNKTSLKQEKDSSQASGNVGRPQKDDAQKSDKTIANRESM